MPRLTQPEFAEKCGIGLNYLSVNKKRKKVITDEHGFIDDTNEINQLFLQKCLSRPKSAKKDLAAGPISGVAVEVDLSGLKEKEKSKKSENDEFSRENTLVDLQKEKGTLEIQLKNNSIELQRLEIKKKRGELVPTQSVKNLIIKHSESIKTSYSEASDNLIVIISHKKQLSSEEVADIRSQFVKIINKAIDNAITFTLSGLNNIVTDYSSKRGVGQHG